MKTHINHSRFHSYELRQPRPPVVCYSMSVIALYYWVVWDSLWIVPVLFPARCPWTDPLDADGEPWAPGHSGGHSQPLVGKLGLEEQCVWLRDPTRSWRLAHAGPLHRLAEPHWATWFWSQSCSHAPAAAPEAQKVQEGKCGGGTDPLWSRGQAGSKETQGDPEDQGYWGAAVCQSGRGGVEPGGAASAGRSWTGTLEPRSGGGGAKSRRGLASEDGALSAQERHLEEQPTAGIRVLLLTRAQRVLRAFGRRQYVSASDLPAEESDGEKGHLEAKRQVLHLQRASFSSSGGRSPWRASSSNWLWSVPQSESALQHRRGGQLCPVPVTHLPQWGWVASLHPPPPPKHQGLRLSWKPAAARQFQGLPGCPASPGTQVQPWPQNERLPGGQWQLLLAGGPGGHDSGVPASPGHQQQPHLTDGWRREKKPMELNMAVCVFVCVRMCVCVWTDVYGLL